MSLSTRAFAGPVARRAVPIAVATTANATTTAGAVDRGGVRSSSLLVPLSPPHLLQPKPPISSSVSSIPATATAWWTSSQKTATYQRFQSALAAALSSTDDPTPIPASSSAAAAASSRNRNAASGSGGGGGSAGGGGSGGGAAAVPELDPDFLRESGIDPDRLLAWATQKPTPLRLADMYKYGTSHDGPQRLRNAQFLHREIPIRIAQRAVDLLTLPHGLSKAPPIREVAEVYLQYLRQLQSVPCPQTSAQEEAFTDILQTFVLDRTSVPVSIARGVSVWHENRRFAPLSDSEDEDEPDLRTTASSSEDVDSDSDDDAERTAHAEKRTREMEEALYRFFTARVGLRFLTEHHVLSCARPKCQELRNVTHMFPADAAVLALADRGCIQSDCRLVDETRKVADLVVQQTTDLYGLCPTIEIVDCQQRQASHDDDRFTYATHHLHYMLAELLKNACRATVQQYLRASDDSGGSSDPVHRPTQYGTLPLPTPKLHPVRVIITKGEEDVTIKIADRGGGIPRSSMSRIWKFGHSHSDEDEFQTDFGTVEGSGARIRGFGLPLARIYARYFGGELNLKSLEGYGVDAYLHLPRLGSCCENLPLRVRASPGERDSTPGAAARGRRNYSSTAAANVAR